MAGEKSSAKYVAHIVPREVTFRAIVSYTNDQVNLPLEAEARVDLLKLSDIDGNQISNTECGLVFKKFVLTRLCDPKSNDPLVSFSVTQDEGGAFLITQGEVRVINRPELNWIAQEKNINWLCGKNKVVFGKPRTKFSRDTRLKDILRWI